MTEPQARQPDRLERLVKLVMVLRTEVEPITRRQLEDLFPIYRGASGARRFEDDKRALTTAGIPLTKTYPEGERGAAAYRIDADEYYLPPIDLSPDELVAFSLAAQSVNFREVTWAQLAGTKLGAIGPPSATVAHLPVDVLLPDLVDAVTHRCTLTIGYHGTGRAVDPYGLVLARGRWYLVAWCHLRARVIPFRVDRIEAGSVVVGAEGGFTRPDGFDARVAVPDDPKQMGDGPTVVARVRVPADLVPLALDGRDPQGALEPSDPADPSGQVVVRVPVTHRSAFRSWVLALGPGAQVLEPAELRADLLAWLRPLAGEPVG